MTVPDPVDARLLTLLAEVGRVAVHDLAARAGMDAREVAARLAALATTGLPLVVGVECDQAALRFALARQQGWTGQPPLHGSASGPPAGHPPYPQGPPSGPQPIQQPIQQGSPRGAPNPRQAGPSGPVRGPGGPAGPGGAARPGGQVAAGPPGGQAAGPPGGQVAGLPGGQVAAGPRPGGRATAGPPANTGTPSHSITGTPGHSMPPGARPDAIGTWGPPQTAAWARGDRDASTHADHNTVNTSATERTVPAGREQGKRTGRVGDALYTESPDGEPVSIKLVEVVDPADFLFTAAGYRLQPGERAVVVHTELTNRGSVPFSALPDLYLVLVDVGGATVSKAPVSLSSRPPHRIGTKPGETAGGHTVYVLPEDTELASVRWSTRPDDNQRAITWALPE